MSDQPTLPPFPAYCVCRQAVAESGSETICSACDWPFAPGRKADKITVTAAELAAMRTESCPCEFPEIEPCDPHCTCRVGGSSRGCRRCCRYGSREQQASRARGLAAMFAFAETTTPAELEGLRRDKAAMDVLRRLCRVSITRHDTNPPTVVWASWHPADPADALLAAEGGKDGKR